ncbi:helix-turn-helix domain-containing protein [Gordonia hydrophobica]|uniref:AraC family transcriptional regulator n=1 Tax=Gordonia hydrophobica TaxID=40516 RepID=A0ABZ2U4Q4_9ACTN|nr:AraC family transcriptional regulator [Gordonia hydrophobica]MBM7368325.1 AraC-like DNA-binding protein [Gordonia hydrophobica]
MELRNVRGLTGVDITPYDISGGSPGRHLGLPSATATLIIDLADGLVLGTENRSGTDTYRCVLAGMHLRPVTIHHDGSQVGVQVSFSPTAVRTVFGVPAGELMHDATELSQLDAPFARRLHERLAQARRQDRAAVCAAALTDIAADDSPVGDAFAAWDYLARRRGKATIADLVEQSGWSARHLTTLFTAEFGVGPKQAARLMRFDAARAALAAGTPAVDVAIGCGYADQSHMSREFTDLTGHPPRALQKLRAAEFA